MSQLQKILPHRDLTEVVRSPGFTPASKDIEPLVDLLKSADDKLSASIERALARGGTRAIAAVMQRFADAEPPLRAKLCGVIARAAGERRDADLVEWLFARATDRDAKTRRRVFRALGQIGGSNAEALLVEAWSREALPEKRAIARALGAAGGDEALRLLSAVHTNDAELARVVGEAKTKLERAHARSTSTVLDASRRPAEPLAVLLHVRAGLEELLREELDPKLKAKLSGGGRVMVTLSEPLEALWKSRLMLHFGFPVPPEPCASESMDDVSAAIVRALGSDAAWRIFSTYTNGPMRYRLEWASAGRRRGTTWNVARALARVRPELINDPVDAPWEAVITVRSQRGHTNLMVELWPRGLDDPRFVYRQHLLPASSHPTIAAALARVGGVRDDDVVWDPFVGAAGELIERAYLGPYARLIGSDSSLVALEAAADNLRLAGIARAELRVGDARSFQAPDAPSLVLTNPPFGRRVVRREEIADVLDAAVANIARQLVPGGRFVWVSPMPRRTLDRAELGGLALVHRFTVDMGGFDAEVQAFRKPAAKARLAKRGKRF